MIFKIRSKEVGAPDSAAWWESYDKPEVHTEAQAQQWAVDIIKRFNNSLRADEKPRELIRVWCFGDSKEHTWNKLSLITEPGGFDRMQCGKCGVTGKRYGLGQNGVAIDPKFKAKKYQKCSGKPWPKTADLICH